MNEVDLCRENGEYHTFVYDGPIFKKPVEFRVGERRFRDNHWFLELKYPNSF
jgi:diphthamide synthase (EF-2-diphthine--ammonia ligase)